MKNISLFVFSVLILTGCSSGKEHTVRSAGPEVISFRALPFPLEDVRLLDGPFLHATQLDEKILFDLYDPDRLLSKFYTEAGLLPKADHYPGWENESLAGHTLGHYLSACSMMYGTTADERFLHKVNYIIRELKKIQDADGDGYLGAFPDGKRILSQEVGKGIIRSQGFDLNGIWSPFYTEHKILAGLRDAYHYCGSDTALMIEKNLADWIHGVVMPIDSEKMQEMLRCEHGGIAETFADLWADTKESRYLELAGRFYQKSFLDSMKAGKDILAGKHCNTNIPKLIALARLYELTGDASDMKAVDYFWNTVVRHHSYVTGGNGDNEYFGTADKLRNRLDEGTTESCNVYNMLKLSEHLFEWTASANVADYYERALFNHILSTQDPETGNVTYNLSLDMGGYKYFQYPYEFTCCIGTGMENHSKYGLNIYYHNNEELFVFQFIASSLTWEEKGINLIQKTGFPEEQATTIEFSCKKPVRTTLQVRYPSWAKKGIEITVNGKKEKIRQEPGSFVPIERIWQTGDIVKISFPFSLRLESMPDDSNRVAVMYGPLVMAGNLGPLNDPDARDGLYVPVLMTSDRDPSSWMKKSEGKTNTFLTINTGKPRDVEMIPFYKTCNNRYTVYWDLFTAEAWETRKVEYNTAIEKEKKIKEDQTDFVQPGEMQPERNHNFHGEKTTPGLFKERANRESRGGWFSFDLKIRPDVQSALIVDYWGGFPGAKTFDILVNDHVLATEDISNKKDGQFISEQYDIPKEISKGKSKITVTFRAHPNNTAGPVFGIRTIKKN
jgi:DUF1680 family protein